ncbi:MAG TPA: type II toxin-antitoxin system HicB family antitoxin [Longimicrobium sp.]
MEKYGMHAFWSDADKGYVAVFPEIPRLSGFGATAQEALAELQEVLQAVVDIYREEGRPVTKGLLEAAREVDRA